VADVAFGAVGWVETTAALDELVKLDLKRGESLALLPELGELGLQERVDVDARCFALVVESRRVDSRPVSPVRAH
jgi:hypothetical protein